jgi:protein-ribulosamine 3-kinase
MAIFNKLLDYVAKLLATNTQTASGVKRITPVGGGSINQVYCLHTNVGKYLLKVNSASTYPQMFKREAEGLNAIAATGTISVPGVIACGQVDDRSFLLMEWIENMRATSEASVKLGKQLAQMHRNSSTGFGFATDNYMGSLTQSNKQHETWKVFFIEERLSPMVKLALSKGLLNRKDVANFELLYAKLNDLFDEEPSSLIHGDLWGGNYLVGMDDQPYLIDPAVSYGHREFDIAMTTLFGGFSNEFYLSYHEAFPLAQGWQQRIDLWNLYPLLVHVNLFGMGYVGQVRDGLKQYV